MIDHTNLLYNTIRHETEPKLLTVLRMKPNIRSRAMHTMTPICNPKDKVGENTKPRQQHNKLELVIIH